ncbi:hypothetical protein M0811_07263 [Anaeramoeba ignava]|uniref:UDENN domain-containing protein n=1 Tax=Anaeramoeba ignava TaxID=1746090 RepID=A0A9Q0LPT1_ANAIG|nr:hypothetical protein M0811_07263 [Anaeramoeba ignava]
MEALQSISIIELDLQDDLIVSWTYPSISEDLQQIIAQRSLLKEQNTNFQEFSFSKFQSTWIYIYSYAFKKESKSLPEIKAFSIALLAQEFHPEKYKALAKLLSKTYRRKGNPLHILEQYLSVFSQGKWDNFNISSFDRAKALSATSINEIITLFGEDFMLIWCALMMKKNIVVFSHNLDEVLKIIRGLPLFVWHRENFDILRPFVQINNIQLQDLQSTLGWVAGFTDPDIRKQNFYDVFVDLTTKTIEVGERAQGQIVLTEEQKSLGQTIFAAVESGKKSDQAIIKALTRKNKEFISKIKSISGENQLTIETIQKLNLPKPTEIFVLSLASAEGIL